MSTIKIDINDYVKEAADKYVSSTIANCSESTSSYWDTAKLCVGTTFGSTEKSSYYINKSYFKNFKIPGNFKVFIDSDKSSFKIGEVYIKEVIYSNPATVILWSDGSKTTCKTADGDMYNPEYGLLLCVLKKVIGNQESIDLLTHWAPNLNELIDMSLGETKFIRKTFAEIRQYFNKLWRAKKKSEKDIRG